MCCWQGYGTDGIDRMVTLGSPHKAPPKASIPALPCLLLAACLSVTTCPSMYLLAPFLAQDKGLVDQTRGILTWVTENCPDNFHQEVGYATVSAHFLRAFQLLCTVVAPVH